MLKKLSLWFQTADIVIVILAFLLSYCLRQYIFSSSIQPLSFYLFFIFFAAVSFFISFSFFHLYDKKRYSFSISYFVDFLKAFFFWGFSLIAFSFFTKTDYSRIVVAIFFILTAMIVYGIRIFISWFLEAKVPQNGDSEIIEEAKEIITLLKNHSKNSILLTKPNKQPNIFYYLAKRIFDIAISLFGLLAMLFFLPLIVLWIRYDTAGPAIISQKRIGRNGKQFTFYKFRTMIQGTPLYASAPKKDNDSRITRAGRILRKFSIDEVPQFWNILKGEMSIVGPRPEMPFIIEQYQPWQKIRLQVKPGITGLWQILGRKDLPLEENLEYDLYYAFNQSLFLDLAIILKTLPHLLFPKGAY